MPEHIIAPRCQREIAELTARRDNLRATIMCLGDELNEVELAIRERQPAGMLAAAPWGSWDERIRTARESFFKARARMREGQTKTGFAQ